MAVIVTASETHDQVRGTLEQHPNAFTHTFDIEEPHNLDLVRYLLGFVKRRDEDYHKSDIERLKNIIQGLKGGSEVAASYSRCPRLVLRPTRSSVDGRRFCRLRYQKAKEAPHIFEATSTSAMRSRNRGWEVVSRASKNYKPS
jgi:hypothetical protein